MRERPRLGSTGQEGTQRFSASQLLKETLTLLDERVYEPLALRVRQILEDIEPLTKVKP